MPCFELCTFFYVEVALFTFADGFILFQGDSAPYTLHLFSSEGKLVTKAPYKTEIAAEDLLQVSLLARLCA